jgi:DNA-binding NtrC family response regulator
MTPSQLRTLAVIDDDALLGDLVAGYLGSAQLQVLRAASLAEARRLMAQDRLDVVLLDQCLPDGRGTDLCSELLTRHPRAKIIFATAYPSFDHALTALRAGAYDYLAKPFELDQLENAVNRALTALTLDQEKAPTLDGCPPSSAMPGPLAGSTGGLAAIDQLVTLAARCVAPVLLTGETGTGKSVVARAIHDRGLLRQAPFVKVNCAALPDNLIEAELFGFERGAFTGAAVARKGLFELASGGTLFLDEIGELPLHLQSKLLGVLDDQRIRPLGAERERQISVRVIAATNLDLDAATAEGRFRQDLYYRLGVLQIPMPTLRERPGDLQELVEHLLGDLAPGQRLRIAEADWPALKAYPWPGNVRELRNVLERAILLRTGGDPLRPASFLPRRAALAAQWTDGDVLSPPAILPWKEQERRALESALTATSGNLTQAARQLGLSLSTLRRKIKSYQLTVPAGSN